MNAGSTDVVASSARRFNAPGPAVGVALGAGGARGLAHIVVLEALEELGVRAVAVSGSSMGAIVGARALVKGHVPPRVAVQCASACAMVKYRQPALIMGSVSCVRRCRKNA